MSRWLVKNSKILIIEEPTRGFDVLTKAEIFQIVRSLSEKGNSFIIVSSEFPELISECDKIIVMHRGKVAGEIKSVNTSQEEIMAMAGGVLYKNQNN